MPNAFIAVMKPKANQCYLGSYPMLKVKVEAPDDLNPLETSEWIEALDDIIDETGPDRASWLLERLMERAANLGVRVPMRWNTAYMNTIPTEEEVVGILRETGARYAGLGPDAGRTTRENFGRAVDKLRELSPHAVYDERLVGPRTVRGIADGVDAVDLLVHILRAALVPA